MAARTVPQSLTNNANRSCSVPGDAGKKDGLKFDRVSSPVKPLSGEQGAAAEAAKEPSLKQVAL
jgi:hypothetical protein